MEKSYDFAAVSQMVIVGLVVLFFVVFTLISLCLVFKKAGHKPWKALIPVYSQYIQCKFSWNLTGFIVFMSVQILFLFSNSLISWDVFNDNESLNNILTICSNILLVLFYVTNYALNVKLSWSFKKGMIFALGLTLLPFIFLPILAFGKASYVVGDVRKFNKFGF